MSNPFPIHWTMSGLVFYDKSKLKMNADESLMF
jgi:hypothetical protein